MVSCSLTYINVYEVVFVRKSGVETVISNFTFKINGYLIRFFAEKVVVINSLIVLKL